MTHIHWVPRQNKLEIPKDKDEVNKQDIHDCDGRPDYPDTMVVPLTPKPKRKAEAFTRAPPTFVLCSPACAASQNFLRYLAYVYVFIMNRESES
jgi:hypothetical protein